MAFATIAGVNTGAQTTNTTTHPINLPTGIVSGDLLLAFISLDGNPTMSGWPTGWTSLASAPGASSLTRIEVRYKIAGASEPASFNLTSSASEQSVHRTIRISTGTYTGNPIVSTVATGTTANPDSPSLTLGSTADWTVWSVFANDDGRRTLSVYPTGYTDGQFYDTSGGAGGCGLGSSRRNIATGAAQDPGAYTISASQAWGAVTLAVKGANAVSLNASLGFSGSSNVQTRRNLSASLGFVSAAARRTAKAYSATMGFSVTFAGIKEVAAVALQAVHIHLA